MGCAVSIKGRRRPKRQQGSPSILSVRIGNTDAGRRWARRVNSPLICRGPARHAAPFDLPRHTAVRLITRTPATAARQTLHAMNECGTASSRHPDCFVRTNRSSFAPSAAKTPSGLLVRSPCRSLGDVGRICLGEDYRVVCAMPKVNSGTSEAFLLMSTRRGNARRDGFRLSGELHGVGSVAGERPYAVEANDLKSDVHAETMGQRRRGRLIFIKTALPSASPQSAYRFGTPSYRASPLHRGHLP